MNAIQTERRRTQLMAAALTISPRVAEKRRRYVLRALQRLRRGPHVAAAAYYLSIGTVPRSLWEQ